MSYSLSDFCADARDILTRVDGRASRETLRPKFEDLLSDAAFCAAHVGVDAETGVQQIYEDPELGFCILAYNMDGPRTSPPHDHGESWALYGQTSGYTDMTLWNVTDEGIEATRTFRLDPGQAGLFDVREIHSIEYPQGAKFVRMTGVDMSKESRRVYDPDTGEVREIEHVGTG